jgi:predicted small lipoprotein YifL
MKRTLLIFFSLLLALSSCGKKGPIQPPVIKVPQQVENFEAKQRGDRIILHWANPEAYSDGSALSEIKEIEIWLLEETRESKETTEKASQEEKKAPPKISLEEFKERSKLEKVIKRDEFPDFQLQFNKDSFGFEYGYELPEKNLTLKRYIFALKVKDKRDKSSDFSKRLSVKPRIIPLPPQEVQLALHEDRIEICWREPEKNIDHSSPAGVRGYNIYRKKDGEFFNRLNSSLIKENKYSDKDFLFGEVYHYLVRASSTESSPFWESADSGTVKILAEDVFAPAPPSGLILVAGEDFISLSWDISREKDLVGYNVWRTDENQEEYLLLTLQPIRENIYNDYAVEKNKRYHYAITAQDVKGNESEKTETRSEEIREE